jgi:RNA polymerase sigma-70 factor (ECF subfamily)
MSAEDAGPSGPSDAELVERARTGRREALEALVRRHSSAVLAVALRESPRACDAEDIAQEAFVKAFRRLDELEDPAAFRGWIRRIAVNLAHDVARRKSRRMEISAGTTDDDGTAAEPPSGAPSVSHHFRLEEARLQIIGAIAALPEDYAQVAAMRYIEALPYEEIAARLGLRRDALRKRMHRANLLLRQALRGAFPELAEDRT